MTNGRYFDGDHVDVALTDGAVNVMARRQFGISLIVAFALLAAAGLIALRIHHETAAGMAARPHNVGAEAPRAEVAPAARKAMTPG
ncbi:hypothetical protein [Methylocapsa sp. S129]|uniref:hypothetical protein n=1 Tax=Methylocapsa sp. S129 TaxID=1641869 RepID=UPI00131E27B3|nr:hypothetical protein [Methylocapsa sp. S129]